MGGELAELLRRRGGLPRSVPAVHEQRVDGTPDTAAFFEKLQLERSRVVLFLTGAGVNALFEQAERYKQIDQLIRALRSAVLVCRGPKPTAALKRYGLMPSFPVASPYTTAEMIDALAKIEIAGCEVALIHYGERNDALAGHLRARKAELVELCLYEWKMPEDLDPLRMLVKDIIDGELDAVVFTSQIQCRHLFSVAASIGVEQQLALALNATVVAAVGPICSAALEALGVPPDVVPENPKMAPLVSALAEHFAAV